MYVEQIAWETWWAVQVIMSEKLAVQKECSACVIIIVDICDTSKYDNNT